MTTNYDPIAEQYRRSKQQPWRTHIEAFTLMELIGDPAGKAVVDLACGEGFYTRLVRQRGAGKVVGIDLSQRMIELARQQEAQRPLGIDYVVGDARELAVGEEYDLAIAAYLLNYARDRAELAAMCTRIARCLRPGGRFVTVNCSPALDFRVAPSYRKYGFDTRTIGELGEGSPITWTFFLEDGSFEIENYFLSIATHEEAFRSAGFREIRWHAPRLAPDGEADRGLNFWASFLAHSPVSFIECLKRETAYRVQRAGDHK
jgi:ubiquinone/menaquinone biosynthesis C-methylase UbiE